MASSLQNVSRFVPVIAHAIAVFGDERKATHWLSTPVPFFENRAPQELFDTDEGLALVEQTLTRIEHNIPSQRVQRVFRVCRALHVRLDGEGARRVGGRWNSPGKPVVYMAESVALAVLENLVHMNRQDFPVGYVVVGASIPSSLEILSLDQLRAEQGDLQPQGLGDRWLESGRSPVLRVPSAVVRSEFNYLLNPRHRDFFRIVAESPVPFTFDERLFQESAR